MRDQFTICYSACHVVSRCGLSEASTSSTDGERFVRSERAPVQSERAFQIARVDTCNDFDGEVRSRLDVALSKSA